MDAKSGNFFSGDVTRSIVFIDTFSNSFSFISIFLLAPEEGLFSVTEILGNFFKHKYFFVLFFCLLLHRLAVRISLPFHIFSKIESSSLT